jgi:hypothetical protein
MRRCYGKNSVNFKYYGGKGITVCKLWHSFGKFFEDMGVRPFGFSLERVYNSMNYSPRNCKWIPKTKQSSNSSNCRYVTFQGIVRPMTHWARLFRMSPVTLWARLCVLKWPVKKALLFPLQIHNRNRL